MIRFHRPQGIALSHPACWLATWFHSGLLKPAPGTWGTLAALPFAWVIQHFFGNLGLIIAAVICFGVGLWAAQIYSIATKTDDASEVVIDEVAAIWGVLSVVPASIESYVLGFLLFRIFDITKIWPASFLDQRLHGGLGIMADDAMAGIYSAICLWALMHWVF